MIYPEHAETMRLAREEYHREWRRRVRETRAAMGPVVGSRYDVHIDHDWTTTVYNEDRTLHRRNAIVERNAWWRSLRRGWERDAANAAARSASR